MMALMVKERPLEKEIIALNQSFCLKTSQKLLPLPIKQKKQFPELMLTERIFRK
jgi:hypothetical protein